MRTIWTSIRLFTSMNSKMCNKVRFSIKFFVAVSTMERFGSKLDPLQQKYENIEFFLNKQVIIHIFKTFSNLKIIFMMLCNVLL